MLAESIAIGCLAALGIYVSSFMLRKQVRGEQGELTEPSVVMTPRSKATGLPNSLLGLAFYAAILILTPLLSYHVVWTVAVVAAVLASSFSVYLAYSLLFVTRMPCLYCWTGHVVNWLLLALLILRR